MTDIAELAISADSRDVVRAAGDLKTLGTVSEQTGKKIDSLNSQLTKTGPAARGSASAAAGAGAAAGRAGHVAQQAGYQFADMAVQIQGGVNPMVAFGQQASQLIGIFGPAGAVAGAVVAIGAAVATSLLPALFDTESAVAKVAGEIDKLNDSLETMDARQRAVKDLAINEALEAEAGLQADLAEQIRKKNEAIANTAAAIERNTRTQGGQDDFAYQQLIKRLTGDLEEQKTALIALNGEMANSEQTSRQHNLTLSKLNGTYQQQEAALQKAAAAEAGHIDGLIKSQEEMIKASGAADGVVSSLTTQAATLGMTAAEARVYALSMTEGVTPAQLEEARAAQVAIDAYLAKQAALKATAAESRTYARAVEQAAEAERRAAERAMAGAMQAELDAENRRLSAGKAVRPVLAGLSGEDPELTRLAEQQARKLEILREGLDAEYLTKAEYDAQLILLDEQTAQRRSEIQAEADAKQRQMTADGYIALLDVAGNYYRTIGGEQAAYVSAAISLAQTLLNEEKRTALMSIVANTQSAAMKAYNALAAIPIIGPPLGAAAAVAVGVAGAAAAAKVSGLASFDGGGYTGAGPRVGGVDGKGGFMAVMHPQERVIDEYRGQSAGGSQQSVTNNFIIQGRPDNRTQAQISQRASTAQRQANARFGT